MRVYMRMYFIMITVDYVGSISLLALSACSFTPYQACLICSVKYTCVQK